MPDERSDHGSASGPSDVLARVRMHATQASEGLFVIDPLLGDPLVQQAVDEFVEQAVDALRAIAELAGGTDPSWVPDAERRRW